MAGRNWLGVAVLSIAGVGSAGGQAPPGIDPVAVADFLRGKGSYGRYDPDHDRGTRDFSYQLLPDWSVRRTGLPAFFDPGLAAGDAPLPRPPVPFAVVGVEGGVTAPVLGRLAGVDKLHTLALWERLSPRAMQQLGALTQLRTLRVAPPGGDGLRPLAGLANLRHLKLDLDHPPPTDFGPLAGLATVRRLDLVGSEIPDAGFGHVARMDQLATLRVENVYLKGDGLKHLAGAKRLTRLELRGVAATDQGIAGLGDLAQLESLHLTGRDVRESTFLALARLRALRRLELPSLSAADGEDPAKSRGWLRHLAGLTKLDALDLSDGSYIGDDVLGDVGALAGVKELRLTHAGWIRDAGLAKLAGMASLETLDLSDNRSIAGAGLEPLAGLGKLRTLSLRECDWLTPEGVAHLAAFPALEHLDIGNWWFVGRPLTDAHLAAFAGSKSLRTLKIDRGRGVTDAGLQALAATRTLEELDLSDNHRITGAGLAHLAGLDRLHTLRLAGCGDGKRLDLTALPRLKALRTLDLARSQIGDDGLAAAAGVPGLEALVVLDGDTRFTAAGLKHLGRMAALKELSFAARREQIGGAAEAVAGLTGLRALRLEVYSGGTDPPPPDAGLRHLAGLTGLRSLVLMVGPIADENLTHLLGLKQLDTLVIFGRVSPAGRARLRDALPNTLVVLDGRE